MEVLGHPEAIILLKFYFVVAFQHLDNLKAKFFVVLDCRVIVEDDIEVDNPKIPLVHLQSRN